MPIRTETRALPREADGVVAFFKRVIRLPRVTEIRVTPDEFAVSRDMEGAGAVIPEIGAELETQELEDLEFVLEKTSEQLEELAFDAERNPYFALLEATSLLSAARLTICGLLAPRGTLLADYFGLDENAEPETLFGIRVLYHDLGERYPDKIVVFGGPTIYFNDATRGVILDTGV